MNIGQNDINLVKPGHYDDKSPIKSEKLFRFPKRPHILSISHSKYQSWISVYTWISKWSSCDVTSQSACKMVML